MKKIGVIVLFLWAGQLAQLSAQQPCNTFDCAFQKAEQILKTSTAKDKYEKVLANLDDAENFAGNDKAKRDKIKALRQKAFLAIQKEKERADAQAEEAKKQAKIANTEKLRADSTAASNHRQTITAYANDLAYKSQIALEQGDRTTAFQLAQIAYSYVEQENPNVTRALVNAIYHNDNNHKKSMPWANTLLGHTKNVTMVAFNPNGELSSYAWDHSVITWDVGNGKKIKQLENIDGSSVAFSFDGKFLATGWYSIQITDLATGEVIDTLKGNNPATSLAFSQDGRLLAIGYMNKSTKIFNLHNKKTLTLKTDTTKTVDVSILSVAFSPDGKHLATGCFDGTISLWKIDKFESEIHAEIDTIFRNLGTVGCVAFSPDSKKLASGLADGIIQIWELESKKNTLFEAHLFPVTTLAFAPSGMLLASGSEYDNKSKIWDLGENKEVITLKGHSGGINSVSFSHNEKYLATGSSDETIRIWDIDSGEETVKINQKIRQVFALAFSPDDKFLASGAEDNSVKIWEISTGKETLDLIGHKKSISCLAFSPKGKYLASGSRDNTILIWDINSKQEILSLTGHSEAVHYMYFSDNEKYLLSSSDEETIIWNLTKGQIDTTYRGFTSPQAISPNEKLRVGAGVHGIIVEDLEFEKNIIELIGHSDDVTMFSFHPNSRYLASSSVDKTVKIWDLFSGKEITSLSGHNDEVNSIAFSQDGKSLATGSYGSILIWHLTPDSWRSTLKGFNRKLSPLTVSQLFSYSLEPILDLLPNNEQKLIATKEVWQIKGFADLAAEQARGCNILNKVEAPYARANRLYSAALALQDELLIRMDWATMLRKWAAVYWTSSKK